MWVTSVTSSSFIGMGHQSTHVKLLSAKHSIYIFRVNHGISLPKTLGPNSTKFPWWWTGWTLQSHHCHLWPSVSYSSKLHNASFLMETNGNLFCMFSVIINIWPIPYGLWHTWRALFTDLRPRAGTWASPYLWVSQRGPPAEQKLS